MARCVSAESKWDLEEKINKLEVQGYKLVTVYYIKAGRYSTSAGEHVAWLVEE